MNKITKLRWRRRFKLKQRQVENLGVQAEEGLEQHFFARLGHLVGVRRFVVGWVLLVVLTSLGVVLQTNRLSSYYQAAQPVPGGTYTEGVIGIFTNANPMYATGAVDGSVSHLLFSGLMKYDQQNQLVGDLAKQITVDDRGILYTVTLRDNAQWHDGYALTADDVVFTYQTIQNPDAKSPLLQSWQGVKVSAKDKYTVVFELPHALTSFPNSLTNGIVPRHILQEIPVSQLRSAAFNTTQPVGSGPFAWETVEVKGTTPENREEQVGVIANKHYYAGEPKLSHFVIRAFHDEKSMTQAFGSGQLTAMAGLDNIPDSVNRHLINEAYSIPLTGEVMVFLKTNQEVLKDKIVRQALVKATNTADVIKGLGYPVITAQEPLLRGQVGYNKAYAQFATNLAEANTMLEQAGWVRGPGGIRVKGGQTLSFHLYAQNNSQYAYVTQSLQHQWRAAGIDAQVLLQPDLDLQTTLAFHNYDALVYGISVGTDPDVFAYWHSSQADIRSPNRLNFSEYNSAVADRSLEAGRTRLDPNLRSIKYQPFLQAWHDDVPAIALYQPRFLYVTHQKVYNFNPTTLNYATDRLYGAPNWMIHEVNAPK